MGKTPGRRKTRREEKHMQFFAEIQAEHGSPHSQAMTDKCDG